MTQRASHRLVFASPFVVSLLALGAAQASACSGGIAPSAPADAGSDASLDAGVVADTFVPPPIADSAVVSCSVNPTSNPTTGEDFIDFCFQKKVIVAQHHVFDPKTGMPSSWSSTTGLADTDGGAVVHDVRDDVAYAASLATFAISAQTYGDSDIAAWVLRPDMSALASLLQAELATLPASYEGELYMRLRRFAAGLRILNDTPDGDKIDALADAYGRAIFTSYFHPLTPAAPPDAGDDGGPDAGSTGDAGEDAGVDAGGDAGDAGTDAQTPPPPIGEGILGVAVSGGGGAIAYDVDQAASGALALADLASRSQASQTGDAGADSIAWARAAGAIMNHLYRRARHPSGLYYADLVTSADPDHDALAAVVSPSDALLSETQSSVAASLMRMSGIVSTTGLAALSTFPFASQVVSPLSGMKGVAPGGGAGLSLWDPTSTTATTAACALLPDASACGGSGFFVRYLPATGLDNSAKSIRANALAFAAIHRSLVFPGTAASIDLEPLTALFESQDGFDVSFLTQLPDQIAYPSAVKADLSSLTPSFSAQANAYAIEALTEQWVGRKDCPASFY